MKKRLVIVALLVIGIAILSAGTIAYFTSQDTAHNVITSGGVKITLDEWMDEVGGTPYPAKPVEVMPGTSVTKIVTVKNQDADAWKFGYRMVGIADAYENKVAGIYLHKKA